MVVEIAGNPRLVVIRLRLVLVIQFLILRRIIDDVVELIDLVLRSDDGIVVRIGDEGIGGEGNDVIAGSWIPATAVVEIAVRVGIGEARVEERDGEEEKECGEQCASVGSVSRSPARAPQHRCGIRIGIGRRSERTEEGEAIQKVKFFYLLVSFTYITPTSTYKE